MKCFILFLLMNICVALPRSKEKCSTEDELIWQYDLRRSYMIGESQIVEAEYGPANVTITCVEINSLPDVDNGVAYVTSGGVGHDYVKIKFQSKYSRGLRYQVFVYGKRTLRWLR